MKKIYLIATIVAIIAGFTTYLFANQLSQQLSFSDVQKYSVVVAVADIPAETEITAEMLSLKYLPKEAITPETVTTVESIVGKVAMYPIHSGEQIIKSDIVGLGDETNEDSKVSYKLKTGEFAFTFEVSAQTSVGYYIQQGDYINILFYHALDEDGVIKDASGKNKKVIKGKMIAERICENVRVLKIGSNQEDKAATKALDSYSCITVVVNKQQSMYLSYALKNGTLGAELVAYSDGLDSDATAVKKTSKTTSSTQQAGATSPTTSQTVSKTNTATVAATISSTTKK